MSPGGRVPVEGWRVDSAHGIRVIRCEALLRIRGLAHVFSTRKAGDSADFDLGSFDSASPAAERRRRDLFGAAGFGGEGFALTRQVHGAAVVLAERLADSEEATEADAVVACRSDRPRLAPAVRTADCVPILIAEAAGDMVAAVHAGWRGTVGGVVLRAVEALSRSGAEPGRLVAALGPAVGPASYEVGPEVLRAVASTPELRGMELRPTEAGRATLDLRQANRRLLEAAGVPAAAIHSAPWCTYESADLFFSYRRDGCAAGRMIAAVGWRDAP